MTAEIINFITEEMPLFSAINKICHKEMYSFHALPHASYGNSDVLPNYISVKGMNLESTVTGEDFDSFFFPEGVIAESQKLTAKLYNADSSFYITGGTSVANQIAITALYEKGDNVLIDKNCHQSVHFHSQSLGANVDYLCSDIHDENLGINAWSYSKLKDKILNKQESGEVYDLIILTAQSYEGIIYDIPEVLNRLISDGVKTRKFFIDEAWGSLNYFGSDTRHLTVMNADDVIEKCPDIELVCTHSAHKSLFCLRQSSLIHCKGGVGLPEKIEIAKYRIHTTSPSYPSLASLDIACHQMKHHGEHMATYSRALVGDFINAVAALPGMSIRTVNDALLSEHWHLHYDPTKVILDVKDIGDANEVKSALYKQNIYIKRTLGSSLLLNFHIGINKRAVEALIAVLSEMTQGKKEKESGSPCVISDKFIIPYPPGVPILFPGEEINDAIQQKINECRDSGLLIIAA